MKRINKHIFDCADCKGMITIEACITGVMFLALMLCLSGLFIVFMAQSKVSDTALKTVQSLSVETYYINKLHYSTDYTLNGSFSGTIATFLSQLFSGNEADKPEYFSHTQTANIFGSAGDNLWWSSSSEGLVGDVVKKRFIGYLTGGDEEAADKLLEGLYIVDGLDGLDFSQSYVSDDTLHVVITYEIKYPFDIADFGTKSTTEKCCSKLWLDGV